MSENELIRFEDLSSDELRKLQLKLVGILESFDKFCKENHLRYFLIAGTLLGAVRHKRFIPWDDDLDVAMPRDDYERLFELWKNEGNRFQLVRPTKDTITGVHIGQVRDAHTTCIYDYAIDYDICHGVKIDIEVLDGAPDSKLGRKIQWFFCEVYGIMSAQRLPHHAPKKMLVAGKIALSVFRSKSVRYALFSFAEKMVKRYKIKDTKSIRVCYGRVMDKQVFSGETDAEFEGKMYPIPEKYDDYLKTVYGEYMQFPPIEKRKPASIVFWYDPDTPYMQYKGVKYCVNNSKL